MWWRQPRRQTPGRLILSDKGFLALLRVPRGITHKDGWRHPKLHGEGRERRSAKVLQCQISFDLGQRTPEQIRLLVSADDIPVRVFGIW